MKKYFAALVAAAALVAVLPTAAMADTYSTGFESPDFTGSALPGTSLPQGGWTVGPSQAPLNEVYDQGIVTTGITGSQSLRESNAVASGEFANQTQSPTVAAGASEAGPNDVFDATVNFKSATGVYQPGLAVSISPDSGEGSRMSFVRLEDQADGIHVLIVDNPDSLTPDVQRLTDAGVALDRTSTHTVRFLIETIPNGADVVRVFIDGVDIGNKLKVCFTTWENYYRGSAEQAGNGNIVPPINSLIVMARGTSVPSVAGGGYLFDDVAFETRSDAGPAANTQCLTQDKGAFCSPGYWKNAPDSAWAKTGVSKTSTFNSVVVPDYYATPIVPANTTLAQVLNAKGANTYGKAAGPFGLNPYNAVGAALTSKLTGYVFDPAAVGALVDTCPLDGNGNWKPGAGPTS